jgi:hypothetical protein
LTQTITPWNSCLDFFKTGPLPAMPSDTSFSMIKGSICSTIAEPSPWNTDEQALRLTCSDNELKAPTPSGRTPPSSSSNPGVMACGPQRQFTSGTVAYTRWRFLVPSEFPELIPNAFCLLGEFHGGVVVNGKEMWLPDHLTVEGSPFGSPATALTLDMINGTEYLCLARGYPKYDRIWKVPLVRDTMTQVIFGCCFSEDPDIAWRKVYLNGVQQRFVDGSTKWFNDPTLHECPPLDGFPQEAWGAIEELTAYQCLYFSKKMYAPSVAKPGVVWHGDMVVENTWADAA